MRDRADRSKDRARYFRTRATALDDVGVEEEEPAKDGEAVTLAEAFVSSKRGSVADFRH